MPGYPVLIAMVQNQQRLFMNVALSSVCYGGKSVNGHDVQQNVEKASRLELFSALSLTPQRGTVTRTVVPVPHGGVRELAARVVGVHHLGLNVGEVVSFKPEESIVTARQGPCSPWKAYVTVSPSHSL